MCQLINSHLNVNQYITSSKITLLTQQLDFLAFDDEMIMSGDAGGKECNQSGGSRGDRLASSKR